MKPLLAGLQRKVAAYLEQTGMTGRQFDISALQSFGFVSRLNRGCAPNLDTADRVLRFIGEPPIGPMFRREIEAFLKVTGMRETEFGREATRDPAFVRRLRKGTSLQLATVDRVRQWMRDNASTSQQAAIAELVEDTAEDPIGPAPDPVPRRVSSGASPPSSAADESPPAEDETVFLSGNQAAAFLTFSYRTLERFRRDGTGPAHYKLGKQIVYSLSDLLQWARERRQAGPGG